MRKDRLYFFTFSAITVIYAITAVIAVRFFVKTSTQQLLDIQLESSRREAREIAISVGNQLTNGLSKESVIQNIQESIQNTNLETGFISMFDWSGTIVSHPNITLLGQQMESDESLASTIDGEINATDFYDFLIEKQKAETIQDVENVALTSEIIYLYPVANSDLIVGAHANLSRINNEIKDLQNRFYTIFVIMGFVIILSTVITVRLIGSIYEKRIENEKVKLEGEVINLAKLNTALGEYQRKVSEEKPKLEKATKITVKEEITEDNNSSEKGKRRILTYLRNELLSVSTEDIAYIYTENTITYVIDVNGKRSTANNSLDVLYSGLDSSYFYRANRQFIIAISSIEKIIRYGNNQLKILVAPKSEVDIIIGKNKAAEFKQWLNM
ncbi:MAG: LytTR family DNA-binding domain-containing protein [Maribacter sp.]